MRAQVECDEPAVPGAEVVDAAADDGRRLDRRADVVAPAHRTVRAIEQRHAAAHRVMNELGPVDRERRRHDGVRPVPPQHAAVSHRDRVHDAAAVADVRDAVVDDRRELDEPAERHEPHALERRPQMDVHLRLRARERRAVHRPLQVRPIDAHGHETMGGERLVERARPEAACADGDVHALPVRDADDGLATPIRACCAMPQPHGRAAHARAAVTVDDGDDQLRRPKGREVAWRLRRRGMVDRPAAATGNEDRKQNP